MAEESKQNFDPDATVAQPAAAPDPDATVAHSPAALDPEATVDGPIIQAGADPEATFTGPMAVPGAKGDTTVKQPTFDPDATLNPAEKAKLDPDATLRMPSPGKLRGNPFAPKSQPETILANLASLGGVNPLVAIANPILSAVPQIRRALKHPDPAALRSSLRDQIESLNASAMSAEITDATVDAAVYALCALLDESAAATPWGVSWAENGLLKEMRGETDAAQGFFTLLDRITAEQSPANEDSADLLEFLYVCLALGFEGRYRTDQGGRQALSQLRSDLYALISRRRPRPDELSARWRSATAEAAAAPALQMAAQVSAQIFAQQAAGANPDDTLPPVKPSFLSRVPRRAVWSALAGVVGTMIVFYLAALRLLDDETRAALAFKPKTKTKVEQAAAAPAPAPTPAYSPSAESAQLLKALAGEPVTITQDAGRIALALRHERQFSAGGAALAAELRPLIEKIAAALETSPGAIVVTGHADASPTRGARYASNSELSAARARAVAQLMAPKLSAPGRLRAEGKGDAEPIAPGDTPADRARNRRITIAVTPNP